MPGSIRIGLIGLGSQIRDFHLPFLEQRGLREGDVEIGWISGYVEEDRRFAEPYESRCPCRPGDAWRELLVQDRVDAVLVSLPNALHEPPIRCALDLGVNVAVDKPTTVEAAHVRSLVETAERSGLVFLTIAQRRYEAVYRTVRDLVAAGELGRPKYIGYLIAHSVPGRGGGSWHFSKRLSGGGALISSGYHGIDIVLWLLAHGPTPAPPPSSVSAQWILDDQFPPPEPDDRTESVAAVRIMLGEGEERAVFQITASFESPRGSLDENIKIFGTRGAVRLMRDRIERKDMSAASLVYQSAEGGIRPYDTSGLAGERSAPVADFVNAVLARKRGESWQVVSPAKDSVRVVEIIEKAYQSAERGGEEIPL
ncbi:MAG: Gfo/Idh/MocA family oxidoreductase [Acidobacteriota bacterium]